MSIATYGPNTVLRAQALIITDPKDLITDLDRLGLPEHLYRRVRDAVCAHTQSIASAVYLNESIHHSVGPAYHDMCVHSVTQSLQNEAAEHLNITYTEEPLQ